MVYKIFSFYDIYKFYPFLRVLFFSLKGGIRKADVKLWQQLFITANNGKHFLLLLIENDELIPIVVKNLI
jgi:hypothetical protein